MTDNQKILNKITKEYKDAGRIKECFYHKKEECQGKVKQAHSIQKNGKLTVLESNVNGNMSVYTFANASQSSKNLMEDLIPVGKNQELNIHLELNFQWLLFDMV